MCSAVLAPKAHGISTAEQPVCNRCAAIAAKLKLANRAGANHLCFLAAHLALNRMGKSHCSLGEAFVHWPVVAAAGNADAVVGWRVVDGESEVGEMQLWACDHAELLGEFLGAVQVPDHLWARWAPSVGLWVGHYRGLVPGGWSRQWVCRTDCRTALGML